MVNDLRKMGGSFGIFFLIFILLIFTSPLVAFIGRPLLGRVITNFLFFWPQLAILPFGIMNHDGGASESYLSGGPSVAIAALFWILIAVAYAWLTRRLRFRFQALLVYPVIVLITIFVSFIMSLTGYSAYLDGP